MCRKGDHTIEFGIRKAQVSSRDKGPLGAVPMHSNCTRPALEEDGRANSPGVILPKDANRIERVPLG